MLHIVVVEDEVEVRQEVRQLLENALYRVSVIEYFEEAARTILEMEPDLVILDLNLPGVSGYEICSQIRRVSEVPVIFLTSRTDSMDELTGMLKGGDDYITKPFQPPILLARIAAVLKRSVRGKAEESLVLTHRGVVLDVARGYVSRNAVPGDENAQEGKSVPGGESMQAELTKNELKILHCLFLKKGKIVSRMELIEYLWDHQVYIDDNTLSVNMTRIRNKLAEIGIRDFIETKRGMGYCI